MKRSDIGVIAFIYATCLFFGLPSLKLADGAGVYPGCLCIALAVLNTIYLLCQLVKLRASGIENDLPGIFKTFLPKQFFVLFALGCVYLVLMWLVGFYASTLIYLVSSLLFLKVPKLHIAMTIGVLALLVYLAFTLFLKVPLPLGILFE